MMKLLICLLLLSLTAACRSVDDRGLGLPQAIAPGVRFYTLANPDLINPPGPLAVQILRLDPLRVRLESALAQDRIIGTETVESLAERHGAIAAVNAGFFAPNGDPTGLLQIDGELVSDTARPRGAVAITEDEDGRTVLHFDVVSAAATVRMGTEPQSTFPISGIDTTRQRGRLMLFTPTYHEHTDTARRGIEWVLEGSPPVVREVHIDAGSTKIPADGIVLSYGGLDPPPPLDTLDVGDSVAIERRFSTTHGTAAGLWESAEDVVGGAGMLLRGGQPVQDWTAEALRPGFTHERHPRTMIGVDGEGDIWLVTVDGRNPQVSLGMTLGELQRLGQRLELVDALNLDGGGSTTLVVRGAIVNHPSDAAGPRKVSDALLVFAR